MKVRTFTAPFRTVVGNDAHELDFGPDDYLVVRPIFGLSRSEVETWATRIREVGASEAGPVAEEAADHLILDLLRTACIEWHLAGPDGPIPQPGTREALSALPAALAAGLFGFLTTFRGHTDPTTRG